MTPDAGSPTPPAHLDPRAVDWRRGLAWYEEAMRLFRRAPVTLSALGFLTLAAEIALEALPGFGPLLGKIVVPLVACGMLYAAAALDRGERASLRFALAAFGAPPGAIAAVVAASLLTFGAEALAAWWLADANLLGRDSPDLSLAQVFGVYAIGILASLPVTFVPFHVLFERVGAGAAFAASLLAFAQNALALLVYAAASLALLGLGVATMGLGLVVVLPLWAASSYAAWKDVFALPQGASGG